MKYNIYLLLTISLLSILSTSYVQCQDFKKLDSVFYNLEKNNKWMGTVELTKDGITVYTHSIGYADLSNKVKHDKNTKYRIGSITKMFTTVMIMKAIQAKKIKLTDKLSSFYPQIKNADKITLQDLLYHRSGIHNFTDESYLQWNTTFKSKAQILDTIVKYGIDFEPESDYKYSNSNFVLLGYILEDIYKKPYSHLLNKLITKNLKLTNTFVGSHINIKSNEAYSYNNIEDQWELSPETDMSIPAGAGCIVSDCNDLNTYAKALFDYKLIDKKYVDMMIDIQSHFGMGIFLLPFYDKVSYGHTGGIDGFGSMLGYFPIERVSFCILSNAMNYSNNSIAISALSAIFGKDFEIPDFKDVIISDSIWVTYEGTYSAPDFPLKVMVSLDSHKLKVQATGQPYFYPNPVSENKFKFEQAGLEILFDDELHTLTILQGGGKYILKKE